MKIMKRKIIDLTFPVFEGMMTYPACWHQKVEIAKLGEIRTVGRETCKIILGSHTGTHIDAPAHFISNSYGIDKLPLDVLIGKALIVDFKKYRGRKEIALSDLKMKIKRQKNIERIIFRYDWSEEWGQKTYYINYPYLSLEACNYLIDLGVKLVGMDTPSPDGPPNDLEDSPNHKLFLKNNIVLVEYLCNLKSLRKPNIFLIALPLKIKDTDGSPARVVAYEI